MSFNNRDKKDSTNIIELTQKITKLKNSLGISDELAKGILEQFDQTFEAAKSSISLVGGGEDELAKMWGFNFGALLYAYLEMRDTLEGRQALSFIKMQLGHELNTRIAPVSELHYASFVLGLSLRFMRGFEKLKQQLTDLEEALVKFEKNQSNQGATETKKDLFSIEKK